MYHYFCFTEEKVRQRGEKTCLNISEQFSSRSQNRSSLSGLTCPTLDLLISNWNFALFAGVTLSCLHSMWLFIYYSLLNNGLKLSQIFFIITKNKLKISVSILCKNTNPLLFPISTRIPSSWGNFSTWEQHVYCHISSSKWHTPLLILCLRSWNEQFKSYLWVMKPFTSEALILMSKSYIQRQEYIFRLSCVHYVKSIGNVSPK